MEIVGREREIEELREYYRSSRPEFLVVYGRRRVGKTYLIKEHFHEAFDFYATGSVGADRRTQLMNFAECLSEQSGTTAELPKDWHEAFRMLKEHLASAIKERPDKRCVIFLDELPWFDTQRSGFLSALDYFWNSWASSRPQILLITCGSATSWMMNNLILDTGGLYNRVTGRIALKPFSLGECKQYFERNGFVLTPYQLIEIYMVVGGIPFYLSVFRKGLSPAQNIDRLCFSEGGALTQEFGILYRSLFKNAENHIQVVRALGQVRIGLTQDDIVRRTKMRKGGTLTKTLSELEQCGFIRSYRAFAKSKRGTLYQLIDLFSLFSLNFIEAHSTGDEGFWLNAIESGSHHAWAGYAFEQVCLWHLGQIRESLGISGVITRASGWRSESSDPGAQIDLVIDRNDGIINLCEMKYANAEFEITKTYDKELRNKRAAFVRETKTRKAVHTTFVTVYGLVHNEYYNNVQSEVIADGLFR